MTYTPNWVSVNLQLGWPAPGTVDTGKVGSDGTTVVDTTVPIGTQAQFRDTSPLGLGTGTFIFLPGVTNTARGDVVTYRLSNGGASYDPISDGAATARWTGTGNTGAPLAVATAATDIQTKWGWYQVQGAAVVNVTGTIAAGNSAYFGQTATLGATVAGGKQVLGAVANSAAGGNLESGKAVYTLNNPTVQSQIT